MDESSGLIKEIKGKIQELRSRGLNLYPSGYKRTITIEEVLGRFGEMDNEELEKAPDTLSMAGRVMAVRNFGNKSRGGSSCPRR